MKKKVLSEKFIVKGKLPKESLVDNVLLRAHILEADEEYKDKTEINNIPLTDSIPVKHHKHIFWVFDYVRDMFNLKNFSTTSIFFYFGIVNEYKQNYPKTNNFNFEDPKNSPEFTLLYCVQGYSDIDIEYKNKRNLLKKENIILTPGHYAMFNSDLNYFIKNNPVDRKRILINYNVKIVDGI